MANWECAFCHAVNPPGRACELCGREREKAAVLAEPVAVTAPGPRTCIWETRGQRCQLSATIYVHAHFRGEARPDGYCAWHHLCLSTPALAERFEEFERFQLGLLEGSYCNDFTHHPAAYVWEALRGKVRPVGERKRAVPCASSSCWVELLVRL